MEPKFDFNSFLHRKKLKHREAAPFVGVSQSLVAAWASNRAVPSYESMGRLIEAGMTVTELFGEELSNRLKENDCCPSMEPPTRSDLKAVVREIMDEIKSESDSPNP